MYYIYWACAKRKGALEEKNRLLNGSSHGQLPFSEQGFLNHLQLFIHTYILENLEQYLKLHKAFTGHSSRSLELKIYRPSLPVLHFLVLIFHT